MPMPALRRWLLATSAAALTWCAATAAAQERTYRFEFPQQPLSQALRAYGQAAGQQIVFTDDLVTGRRAPELRGTYTAKAALDRLLEGSDLIAERNVASVIMIRRKPAATEPASPATYEFDIPPQNLAGAMEAFSRVTGRPVDIDEKAIRGVQSAGLKGGYTAEEGLRQLLIGTGFEASTETRADGAIAIRSAGEAFQGSPSTPTAQASVGEANAARVSAQPNSERPTRSTSAEVADDEIVVTGSRLPDVPPASPVRVFDRNEIDRSGFGTTGAFVRGLTQVSGSNFQIGTELSVIAQASNFSSASSADLRGLGPGATLTLLNGHRIAYNGTANAVDVSLIPLAAIERIDVLTDGASAIYGSDAVAGVVNFILRDDFDGLMTIGRAALPTRGGGEQYSAGQLLGTGWDRGNFLVNLNVDHQRTLFADDRGFSQAANDPNALIPQRTASSALLVVNQDLASNVRGFVEGTYAFAETRRSQTGFGFTTLQNTDTSQYYVAAGARVETSFGWIGEITGIRSANDERASLRIPAFNLTSNFRNKNTLTSGEFTFSGNALVLPAGDLRLALGGGVRRETLRGGTSAGRTISYAFGEFAAPVYARNDVELTLSGSGRFEDYSDFGSVFTPKVGATLFVSDGVKLRGTWGESFRAPPLQQVFGQVNVNIARATLVQVPGAIPSDLIIQVAGANPDVGPERARSFTVGIDLQPRLVPGLEFSLTYYNNRYRDRITFPFSTIVGVYDNPGVQEFIIKNPSVSVVEQVVADADFVFNGSGGPFDPARVIAIFLASQTNLRTEKIQGVDVNATFRVDTDFGLINVFGDISWLDIRRVNSPGAPEQKFSGRVFRPAEWKARGGLSLTTGRWSTTAFVNYISGSIDDTGEFVFGAVNRGVEVDAWTTADLSLTYRLGRERQDGQESRLSLHVSNIFDQNPPAVDPSSSGIFSGLGYDFANASPLGRVVSISASIGW